MKNQLLKAHSFRFACKVFDNSKKIKDEDFNFILETGRLSPSSFGFEPWQFVVLQNPNIREKVKPLAWGAGRQLDTASHFLIIGVRKPAHIKYDSEYIQHMATEVQALPEDIVKMKLDFFKNFQEKDFDLTDDRKLIDWAGKQAYIPLANMMTSAAALEIDSCPIEGFDQAGINALLNKEGIFKSDEFTAAVMVAFGYRDESQRMSEKTRRPMDEVTKWVK